MHATHGHALWRFLLLSFLFFSVFVYLWCFSSSDVAVCRFLLSVHGMLFPYLGSENVCVKLSVYMLGTTVESRCRLGFCTWMCMSWYLGVSFTHSVELVLLSGICMAPVVDDERPKKCWVLPCLTGLSGLNGLMGVSVLQALLGVLLVSILPEAQLLSS